MPERYKALQHSYEQLEADFHMLANSIPQLAWMTRPDGWIFWYNQRWFDYTGTTLEEMQGWGWRQVHHPDHVDRVIDRISQAFETGEPWEDTFPLKSKDGEYRWFLSRTVPIRDSDGNIIRWFGTNTDVTEQKRLEERQALLMREIDHRAKNVLAVAQSVVSLTRAETVEGYKEAVEGRIGSLTRAHSLLAASRWDGANLHALLQEETEPFNSGDECRVTLKGDNVLLAPDAAQSLALIFHELATNAAKYGALSHQGGQLDVTWTSERDAVHICWRESGGQAVAAPEQTGFGTRLLERIIAGAAGGTLKRTWHETGLQVDIEIATSDAQPDETTRQAESTKQTQRRKAQPLILVVEDEPLTAMDLEVRLQDAGFEVIGPVDSVASARELIGDLKLDIALLDSNLSGERSYGLAEDLVSSGIPVVFCTGYEELDELPDVLRECAIVPKPFRNDTLFGTISAAMKPPGRPQG